MFYRKADGSWSPYNPFQRDDPPPRRRHLTPKELDYRRYIRHFMVVTANRALKKQPVRA